MTERWICPPSPLVDDTLLERDAAGRLVARCGPDVWEDVVAVRAFPIQAPELGVSVLSADGHEVAWVADLRAVPEPAQTLLRQAMAQREFMPVIQRITAVSSYATPCTWSVETDRGPTQFVLKGEEDIRRLSGTMLLITDSHGIQFLLRDTTALPKESRRILDRFL